MHHEKNPENWFWNPDFCEWKLYHDGDGVAIMHGPEIVAAKDEPNAVLVYDAMMLADDPADKVRLDWRIIFYGKFNMHGRPFFHVPYWFAYLFR